MFFPASSQALWRHASRHARIGTLAMTPILRRNDHEEERVAEKQISFSADRRENQGAGRLAGEDAQPAADLGQASRSRSRRGGGGGRGSGGVARRDDLHGRGFEEQGEDDP